MKFKFNWGTGIFISILLFMVFILSFLYKSFLPEYKHELISDDYYKDELHYQNDIDKLNNAIKLEKNVTLNNTKEGIVIEFPKNFDSNKISGTISFQRLSNSKIDFTKNIALTSHQVIIPDSILVSGKWLIQIDWKYDNKNYLLKENWFY